MKRLTLMGILMVLMALGFFYLDSAAFQPNITGSGLVEFSLPPGNTVSFAFNLTNPTAIQLTYSTNGTPINYFLVNGSGQWIANETSSINASGVNSLKASGAIEMVLNSSQGMFPYQQQPQQNAIVYQLSSTPMLLPGYYYIVFQNPGSSNATVYYVLATKDLGQTGPASVNSSDSELAAFARLAGTPGIAYGLVAAAFLFVGIVLVLYSVVMGKGQKAEPAPEEVDRLYAGIGRRRNRPVKKRKRKQGR
jgi:hypothetical protein